VKAKPIGYWVTTALIALLIGSGGIMQVIQTHDSVAGVTRLGYPVYFVVLLGVWKILGAAAILAPRLPRLKEWAYAGIVFDLTGASASHASSGSGAGNVVAPLIFTILVFASWALRPASRTLGTLLPAKAA
jgi:uncharacterized membrane protein YphA (DoxX/SURF4 family)